MPRILEGHLSAEGLRFAIVVSRFNELITSQLLQGALEGLRRHGARDEQITVAWVPGAFEIPLVAQRLAKSGRFDAVIAIGAVDSRGHAPFRLRGRRGCQRHQPGGPADRRTRQSLAS